MRSRPGTGQPLDRYLALIALIFIWLLGLTYAVAPLVRADSWEAAPQGVTIGPYRLPGSAAPAAAGGWDVGLLLFFPAVWTACYFGAQAVVRRTLPVYDPYLIPLAYLLSGWGIALVWRLMPAFGLRQTAWLVVASGAMLGIVVLPRNWRWLSRYRYSWLAAGLALTALTLVLGVNPSGEGARLWLGGYGLYLQPAEILKILLVVFLAAYLAARRAVLFPAAAGDGEASAFSPANSRPAFFPYFIPLLLMWLFSCLILVIQRDLGMSTLFLLVFLVMVYLASGRMVYALLGAVLLAGGAVAGYYLFDVVRLRVDAWWNPWTDPSGRSFQIVQSLIAIASGGLLGRGPALGAPSLVPVAHSDFIFAAIGEEWGLLGMLAAVGLEAVLVFRGLHIAIEARGDFRQLLAAGLASLLGLQTLLIMGGVVKLIPLTGVTLPFLSYGGSSLVTQFCMMGLLLQISAVEH